MKPAFVDTSGWVGVSNRPDQYHSAARRYAEELLRARIPLVTTNYVLAESYTRIRYDHGHRAALRFDGAITYLSRSRRLVVAWVTPALQERALEIFRKYSDHDFSLVDCASFIAASEHDVRDVFEAAFRRDVAVLAVRFDANGPGRHIHETAPYGNGVRAGVDDACDFLAIPVHYQRDVIPLCRRGSPVTRPGARQWVSFLCESQRDPAQKKETK